MGKLAENKSKLTISENGLEASASNKRVEVMKTYKLYIGGQFPRTESGRYYIATGINGQPLANVCLSSRKDARDAVGAARAAFKGWSARAAFNRGQILYRMAEMLEGRKLQFIEEMISQGQSKGQAVKEVNTSIDRLIHYAGWCDKYQQIFSSVNPVASSHFNFSVPEPTGVVAAIAAQDNALIGLVSVIAPVIAGGNTCIVLASETKPLCAISFAEVLHSSDLPGGVVNILTGKVSEIAPQFAAHMDVNAVIYCGEDAAIHKDLQEKGAANVKRFVHHQNMNWFGEKAQSPYFILDTQEIKTTWHPIENIGAGGGGY
ncbi:MAG: aldehyde dehydrogenase family protein [Flavisolibacter sp.]